MDLNAFQDELEKIAITRPMTVTEPGLYSQHGIAGLFIPNESVWKENPALAKLKNIPKKGPGVIFFPDPEDYSRVHGKYGPTAQRIARRHEMVHWMRHMKGERIGDPGVRGVLRSIKGEIAGHLYPMKGLPEVHQKEMARGLVPGVKSSVQQVYKNTPGGVKGALMGGRLGKVVRLLARK